MICLVTENKKGAKSKEIDDHSDIVFYILKQRKNQDPNRDLLFYFSYFIGDQTGLFFQREEKGLTWLGVRSNNEIFVIENRRKSNKKSNACHDWGHQYFEWLPRNFLKFRESSHKFSGLNDRVLGVGTDSEFCHLPGSPLRFSGLDLLVSNFPSSKTTPFSWSLLCTVCQVCWKIS